MTTITIQLQDDTAKRVQNAAAELGIPVEEFVEKTLDAALGQKDVATMAFDYVLRKNAELYRRLAQ